RQPVCGLRPCEIAERTAQPELAGVEDAVGIERVLHRLQDTKTGSERLTDEARAVQADAVMVRKRAARGDDRTLARIPSGAVVSLALALRWLAGKCEIQARAVAVRVALMRGCNHR